MPISPESRAPGIYIEALTSLPHPIECASTGRVGLLGVTSRAVAPVAITGFGKDPRALGNQASEHIPRARGINLLRFFPVQGNQIWGARTTSQDPEWQSINVRRLVVYIEQSINQGLQWAVFENNGPVLWADVGSSIEGFMTNLWQSGSLRGNKRQDAFFVRCDNATMTQNDIDAGRFVSIVGFAPVRPAEFVVLQITGQIKKKK